MTFSNCKTTAAAASAYFVFFFFLCGFILLRQFILMSLFCIFQLKKMSKKNNVSHVNRARWAHRFKLTLTSFADQPLSRFKNDLNTTSDKRMHGMLQCSCFNCFLGWMMLLSFYKKHIERHVANKGDLDTEYWPFVRVKPTATVSTCYMLFL